MCMWESRKIANTVAEGARQGTQKEAGRHAVPKHFTRIQNHMCLNITQ